MTELAALNIRITGDATDLSAAVATSKTELTGLGTAADRVGKNIIGAGAKLKGFSNAMGGAASHTANLTFQLQDIGMMLAAGQSPLMLAMQQGTQVSGAFMQMGVSAKTVGPVLLEAFSQLINPLSLITVGTIAVVAALGQWAMSAASTKEENAKLTAEIERQKAAIDGVIQATENLRLERGMINTGAQFRDEQIVLEEIVRLTKERAAAQERLNQLVSIGGRATAYADEAKASRDVLSAEIASLDAKIANLNKEREALGVRKQAQTLAETYKQLQQQIASMNISGPWRNVLGAIGDAYNAAVRYAEVAAQAKADAAMWVEKQQPGGIGDLANQYAQYGAGRAAFNRGAQQGVAFSGATAFGGGSGGGGGGGRDYAAELAAFEESLMTESELELAQFDLRQTALEEFLAQRVITQQEYQAYMEQIKTDHEQTMGQIEATAYAARLSQTADLFGQLASIAEIGGQKMVKAVAAAKAIEATINAYTAATAALAQPGLTLAGRFAAYASVLAAGLKGVAAIRSAGSGGGGGGGASIGAAAGAGAGSPLQVNLNTYGFGDFISRADFGSMLDKLGEVAGDRGYRIMVPA